VYLKRSNDGGKRTGWGDDTLEVASCISVREDKFLWAGWGVAQKKKGGEKPPVEKRSRTGERQETKQDRGEGKFGLENGKGGIFATWGAKGRRGKPNTHAEKTKILSNEKVSIGTPHKNYGIKNWKREKRKSNSVLNMYYEGFGAL